MESVVSQLGVTESSGGETVSSSLNTEVTWTCKQVTTSLSVPSLKLGYESAVIEKNVGYQL